jgi:hypothetical protein
VAICHSRTQCLDRKRIQSNGPEVVGAGEPRVGGLHLIAVRPTLQVTGTREARRRERAVEVPSISINQTGQPRSVESLKGLLERLGAPDLTLPEAKQLRSQVHLILSGSDPEREA